MAASREEIPAGRRPRLACHFLLTVNMSGKKSPPNSAGEPPFPPRSSCEGAARAHSNSPRRLSDDPRKTNTFTRPHLAILKNRDCKWKMHKNICISMYISINVSISTSSHWQACVRCDDKGRRDAQTGSAAPARPPCPIREISCNTRYPRPLHRVRTGCPRLTPATDHRALFSTFQSTNPIMFTHYLHSCQSRNGHDLWSIRPSG